MDLPIRRPLAPPAPRQPARTYRRLPAPCRLALYLAACVALSLMWCLLLMVVLRPGLDVLVAPERYPLAFNLYLVGTYAILIGGASWAWRRLQGETWTSLGLADRRWAARLAAGGAWGLASLAGLFALALALGWLRWDASAWAATPLAVLGLNLATALFFGLSEEFLFRGFIFQTLRRGLPLAGAIAASAAFYALVHFLRFDRPLWEILAPATGLLLAGALLAWVTHRTQSIWMAVGVHSAWVYLFFLTDRQKLLVYPIEHNWLTGGGYPLAGAMGFAMLAALGLGLAWQLRRAPAGPQARSAAASPGRGIRPVRDLA